MTSNGELDRVIKELKDRLGKRWKQVAKELNFSRTDVDAIEHRDMRDLKEQIHLFFEEWKMQEGSNATVQKLLNAVRAAGLQQIIDELQQALPELNCGGTSMTPVQESSTDATSPVTPTRNPELEHIRKKRLERLTPSDSNKVPTSSKLESAERTVSRSVSTASNSSAISEETATTSVASAASSTAEKNSTSREFEVGNVVKVEREPKPWYGVVKWIGGIPNLSPGKFAGIEMEELVEGGHSGKFSGRRYFTCEDGYGLILPISQLKRDDRFDDQFHPPTLKGGPTPAGEDVERDEQMRTTSSERGITSPPKSTPNTTESREEPALPAVSKLESIDGVTASSGRILFFVCPGDVAGFIIGRDGKNRREVESKTGTTVRVERNKLDKTANTEVWIHGDKESCEKALVLIVQNIRRKTALHTATTETMTIPNQHCGKVIGKGGANVKAIQNLTGTRINVEKREGLDAILNPEGPAKCEITGSSDQIEKAKELIGMAVEGDDIAQTAFFAAFIVRFMQELRDEGYRFD